MTTVGARFSIQDPIATQAGDDGAGLIPQRSQEAMIAVLAIGHDDMETFHCLPSPMATQRLDLGHAHLGIRLLAGYPPDGHRRGPTAA